MPTILRSLKKELENLPNISSQLSIDMNDVGAVIMDEVHYINDPDPNYRKSIDLEIGSDNFITKFGIYKCKFSDIKDFDTDIIETEFAKHEYEKKAELTLTDEPKMFTINYQSKTHPKDLNDYKISGVVTNIPAASE